MLTPEQLQKEMRYFLDYGTVTELIEMLYCAVADKEHDLDELNKKKCEGMAVTVISQVLGKH